MLLLRTSLSSKDAPDRSRTACYDVEVDIVSYHIGCW